MGIKLRLTTILFLGFVPIAEDCFADQLKIVDSVGLTRAVKKIDGPATVVVKARNPTDKISLNNVDGILPDVEGASDGKGAFRFDGIRDGTWRIINGDKVEIAQVSIER